jgi:hypothetical protein
LCPESAPSVEAFSELVEITWPEVPAEQGRRVTNVTLADFDDSSSVVEIVGNYALDCDYRLSITKIPEPGDGFGRVVRFRYAIRTNTEGTGAPIAQDTLSIAQADTAYFMEPSVAGNLGIRVTPNVNPTSGPLGTISVIAGGLNTSSSSFTEYRATALNTVSSLSEGLRVEVSGPLGNPFAPRDTITVNTPGERHSVMNGMTLSFSEGTVTAGQSITWSARYLFPANARIEADFEAFEGYHFWRSDLPDLNDFTLIGEIRQCESKFDFALLNEDEVAEVDVELIYDPDARVFRVIDRTIHDDFPYRFAVSTFDRGFLGNAEDTTFEGLLKGSQVHYPARRNRTSGVAYAVPNPYKRSAAWQAGSPRIVFANLPTECTIRIFNEAADHVATLVHGPGQALSTSPTSRAWDLASEQGMALVPGIYIFQIEGTNRIDVGGVERAERFEQVGKVIIVR